MKINIIGLQSLKGVDFHALASAYQNIYGARPWCEYKKCSLCGSFWGTHQLDDLKKINNTHCGLPVVDYWPKDYLFNDFEKISSIPMFSSAIAYDDNDIVGFAWGYEMSIKSVDDEMQLKGLAAKLKERHGDDLKIVYLADLAVKPEYRGQGLAKKLTTVRHSIILNNNNANVLITRTKGGKDPSITHLWYEKIGFSILMNYNDSRSRVIRSINVNDLSF